MSGPVLLDTGPLVAFLSRRDRHHDWARGRWGELDPPLLTCEAVLSEACFLLRNLWDGTDRVLKLLARGVVRVAFHLGEEVLPIALLNRYRDVPMSLADACLVRMAELHPRSRILTLARDFLVYRRQGAQPLEVIMPEVA